ncbi:hypothetical protein WN51_02061 [Melipona quadrifasciata]|uniref:Uncharacterized protein n=1 Tax=Melipona quadrifasciata TaxID=166423 RepID=A0A0M8ZX81_9HYME|nr:hypothetical protein WN51_02061 [Melipona quadrifasciata]
MVHAAVRSRARETSFPLPRPVFTSNLRGPFVSPPHNLCDFPLPRGYSTAGNPTYRHVYRNHCLEVAKVISMASYEIQQSTFDVIP